MSGKTREPEWKDNLTDYQVVRALMKRMGAPSFDPLPPDQHKWQMEKGEPPLIRMWAWMVYHTIHWGHRNEYAVSMEGHELHMENMIADLQMDEGNAWRCWKTGVERGLWSNAPFTPPKKPNAQDGKVRRGGRRLYLCGKVVRQAPIEGDIEGEENGNISCLYKQLPDHILMKIKEWPKDRQEAFRPVWGVRREVRDTTIAELVAAGRSILDRDDDITLKDWGLELNRQEHESKKLTPEELAAKRERIDGILPQVQRYVQTVQTFVQSRPQAPYKPEEKAGTNPATLLPQKTPRENPDLVASESSEAVVSRPVRGAVSNQGKKFGYLPAAEATVAAWIKQPKGSYPPVPTNAGIEACERYPEAAQTLFFQFSHIKEIAKQPGFTEFAEDRKTDQILVGRIILIIGAGPHPNRAMQFSLEVVAKFKGIDGGMAKLPGRAPDDPGGPHSFGLILAWAADFAKSHRVPRGASSG